MGGAFVQGGRTTGVAWNDARAENGVAFASAVNVNYDDSVSLLSGFGPNQRVTAVMSFTGTRDDNTNTHEVEIILRGSYAPHDQQLYECNVGYSGATGWYSQIALQHGDLGTFTLVDTGGLGFFEVHDGDVFTAEIFDSDGETTINNYVNGVLVATSHDHTLTTGQPGIGFFWRGTENASDFGFTAIEVTDF